jgi:hypothetical protein
MTREDGWLRLEWLRVGRNSGPLTTLRSVENKSYNLQTQPCVRASFMLRMTILVGLTHSSKERFQVEITRVSRS